MNNKDFILELSNRLEYSVKETNQMMEVLIAEMTQQLQDGNAIAIYGFGTFETKKKAERITINPISKQHLLVPPKIILSYRPSTLLKDKFKNIQLWRND